MARNNCFSQVFLFQDGFHPGLLPQYSGKYFLKKRLISKGQDSKIARVVLPESSSYPTVPNSKGLPISLSIKGGALIQHREALTVIISQ